MDGVTRSKKEKGAGEFKSVEMWRCPLVIVTRCYEITALQVKRRSSITLRMGEVVGNGNMIVLVMETVHLMFYAHYTLTNKGGVTADMRGQGEVDGLYIGYHMIFMLDTEQGMLWKLSIYLILQGLHLIP